MARTLGKQDEIKRKLREFKKLELKVCSNSYQSQYKRDAPTNKSHNIELIWDKFFDLKDESSKNVKYTLEQLSLMNKDEFKNVIIEYFYYVYYQYNNKTSRMDYSLFDAEILSQLGLTIYADNDEIKRKFRELAKLYHPDNGGDSSKFIELIEKYKNRKT